MTIFFRPQSGVAADVIPFFRQGEFHLFYLQDWRDAAGHGEGTPWWHLSTRDFVTYTDHGEAIPRGPVGSQDQWVFTGCVIEHQGRFHAFYTGHNQHLAKVGRCSEAIMRAESDDLQGWRKDPALVFAAPAGYEAHHWRDPFVYRDEERGCWRMLIVARRDHGAERRRGLIASAVSDDLRD